MPFIKQRVLRTRVPPCTAALGLSTHIHPPPHPHTLICNTEYRFPCQGLSCSDFRLSLLNRLVHLTATSRPFLLRDSDWPQLPMLSFHLRPVTSGSAYSLPSCP